MKSLANLGAGRALAVPSDHDLPLLPSRRDAIRLIQKRLGTPGGFVLLTGESGAGKTWLVQQLAEADGSDRIWHVVDVAPGFDHVELLRAVAFQLGLRPRGRSATSLRTMIADELANANDDGRRHVLVVDQAHDADLLVFQEVGLVANRLGRSDGFDAVVLVGQTSLLRGLTRRDLCGVATRIDLRVHLRPIDADEAAEIVGGLRGDDALSADDVERLHRDALGNPARLLQTLAGLIGTRLATAARPDQDSPAHEVQASVARSDANDADRPWIPTRPPLRSEENLIEVGWDSAEPAPQMPNVAWEPPATSQEPEPELTSALGNDIAIEDDPVVTAPSIEPIDDPYAALQAWLEDEDERPRYETGEVDPDTAPLTFEVSSEDPDDALLNEAAGASVWPDIPHPFEPFGDLFSSRSPTPRVDP